MKRLLSTLLIAGAIYAEDAPKADKYDVTFTPSFNASVNLYSDNWTGEELGAANWNMQIDFAANKQLTDKLYNSNWIKLLYGKTAIQQTVEGSEDKEWTDFEKSSDKIEAESALKFTLGGFVDPFIAVKGESQFNDNSDPLNERRVNPVLLKESVGAARTFVKEELVTFDGRFGAAARQNIDKDVVTSYSPTIEQEWQTTNDMGLDVVFTLTAKNKADWMAYSSTLELYEALYRDEHDKLSEKEISDYRTPDIRWVHDLKLNVTKLVILSLNAELLYDKEISDELRMKENFSVGISYTFKNKK